MERKKIKKKEIILVPYVSHSLVTFLLKSVCFFSRNFRFENGLAHQPKLQRKQLFSFFISCPFRLTWSNNKKKIPSVLYIFPNWKPFSYSLPPSFYYNLVMYLNFSYFFFSFLHNASQSRLFIFNPFRILAGCCRSFFPRLVVVCMPSFIPLFVFTLFLLCLGGWCV